MTFTTLQADLSWLFQQMAPDFFETRGIFVAYLENKGGTFQYLWPMCRRKDEFISFIGVIRGMNATHPRSRVTLFFFAIDAPIFSC